MIKKHYHVYLAERPMDGTAPPVLRAALDPETHWMRQWHSRTPANNYANAKKLQHYVATVKMCVGGCVRTIDSAHAIPQIPDYEEGEN